MSSAATWWSAVGGRNDAALTVMRHIGLVPVALYARRKGIDRAREQLQRDGRRVEFGEHRREALWLSGREEDRRLEAAI